MPSAADKGIGRRRLQRGAQMAGSIRVAAAPFTYASHVFGLTAAILVLVWIIHFRGGIAFVSINKNLIFNLHPVCMLIGFIIFGGEAIISYKVLPWSKEVRKLVHLILHAIAIVLGIVGIWAAFKYHNDSGIANLYSLHSWIGIGTISLYGIQWIYGFVTFYYPGTAARLRSASLPWHVLFGLLVYVLAVANAELGFLEKLTFLQTGGVAKYGSEAFLVNFTALLVVLFGASVVISAVAPARIEESQGYVPID